MCQCSYESVVRTYFGFSVFKVLDARREKQKPKSNDFFLPRILIHNIVVCFGVLCRLYLNEKWYFPSWAAKQSLFSLKIDGSSAGSAGPYGDSRQRVLFLLHSYY